jgi:hypothetical protein
MARIEDRITGWWVFAGMLLGIAGVLNGIWGLAAIGDAKFFIADQKYIISSLHTWGWVTLIIGVLQLVAAFSLFSGGGFGRWLGMFAAALSAISGAAVDPRLPVLVAVHLRPGDHRPLRARQGTRAPHTGLNAASFLPTTTAPHCGAVAVHERRPPRTAFAWDVPFRGRVERRAAAIPSAHGCEHQSVAAALARKRQRRERRSHAGRCLQLAMAQTARSDLLAALRLEGDSLLTISEGNAQFAR